MDRLLPRRGRPDAADRGARGRGRRLRRVRPQRRLVLRALPGVARTVAGPAVGAATGALRPARARCGPPSTRSAGSPRPRASTPTSPRAAPSRWPARRPSWRRARAEVADARRLGPRRGRPAAARRGRGDGASCAATRVLGATYTPDCAAIHPGRLVRGLAEAVERRGVTHLRAHAASPRSSPGRVRTAHGTRARRASWSGRPRATPRTLAGQRRAAGRPVYSLIIATEPLPPSVVGRDRAAPARDVQRPPAPDHLRPAHRRRPAGLRRPRRAVPLRLADPAGVRPRRRASSPRCTRTLVDLFPVAAPTPGSPTRGAARSASPRDWCASVGLDRATGLAWAGGYVGDGVSTTNLAGRTLRRPGPRPRHRPDPAALGRPPLPRAGSRSRCAGWASTPACGPPPSPTSRSA